MARKASKLLPWKRGRRNLNAIFETKRNAQVSLTCLVSLGWMEMTQTDRDPACLFGAPRRCPLWFQIQSSDCVPIHFPPRQQFEFSRQIDLRHCVQDVFVPGILCLRVLAAELAKMVPSTAQRRPYVGLQIARGLGLWLGACRTKQWPSNNTYVGHNLNPQLFRFSSANLGLPALEAYVSKKKPLDKNCPYNSYLTY